MKLKKIKLDVSEYIAKITLDRPESLNSLDLRTFEELLFVLTECEFNSEVRVVVLCGEGRAFSSGGDLQYMIRKGLDCVPKEIEEMAAAAGQVALKLRTIEKPVIASLKGAVAGAGFNMALGCDFRIAAQNCKFVQSFINVGLIPDCGGIYVLNRLLGTAKATELAMTGKVINADEAFSYGLITQVVELSELENETIKLAKKLSNSPSDSLKMMKKLINQYEFSDYESYLENEVKYQVYCAQTTNCLEGISAFLEKRKPYFK